MQHGAIRARGVQRLDLSFTELDLGAGDYVKVRFATVGYRGTAAHAQCNRATSGILFAPHGGYLVL